MAEDRHKSYLWQADLHILEANYPFVYSMYLDTMFAGQEFHFCSHLACMPVGTTYADFIRNMHLPPQLSAVDPIVASFCGGAIGVLTTLLLVELYNSDIQAKNRCIYCGVGLSAEYGAV